MVDCQRLLPLLLRGCRRQVGALRALTPPARHTMPAGHRGRSQQYTTSRCASPGLLLSVQPAVGHGQLIAFCQAKACAQSQDAHLGTLGVQRKTQTPAACLRAGPSTTATREHTNTTCPTGLLLPLLGPRSWSPDPCMSTKHCTSCTLPAVPHPGALAAAAPAPAPAAPARAAG